MSRPASRLSAVALAVLLALLAARLLHTAAEKSFTVDEPHYVGLGLYLWESGDYHFFESLRLHPPLPFHLASLPLLAFDLGDFELDADAGPKLLRRDTPSPLALRLAGRLPFVLLTLWGGFLVFAWAREAAGDAAGLLSLFLYSFSPMVLANGSLAHSDITVTVFLLQTLYAFWRWYRKPGPLRLVLCGLSLGLTLVSKVTGILAPAMLAALVAGALVRRRPPDATLPWIGPGPLGARAGWLALRFLGMLAAALVVFWAAYGGSFAVAESPVGPFPGVPLPGYLQSWFVLQDVNRGDREVFFFGEFSSEGWLHFWPVAYAVKEPLGMLALLVAALAVSVRQRFPIGRFLAWPALGYVALLVFWLKIPVGFRYALPVYPLVFVFVGVQLASVATRAGRAALAVGCAALAAASLAAHPHYLAYFNETIGGPERGHEALLDSNLDWGQDLTTLARYLEERGNPPVRLAYYGPEPPARYGIRSVPLRGCEPVPGLVAISLNVRSGHYAFPNPLRPPDRDCYAWLDAYEPVARPGHSIWVYEIPGP